MVRNGLTVLWTLTYAVAEWDPAVVMRDVNRFMTRLRRHRGGRFPYVYVLEVPPASSRNGFAPHGIHVHVALEAKWLSKHEVQRLWGHGLVDFRKPPRVVGEAGDEEHAWSAGVRGPGGHRLARYMAKTLTGYLLKDAGGLLAQAGRHVYEVGQGFRPEVGRFRTSTLPQAFEVVVRMHGGQQPWVWSSDELAPGQWRGPPTYVFRFDA